MVAQRYNLDANQMFKYRRLFREPERVVGAGRFVLVVVEGVPGQEAGAAAIGLRPDNDVAVGPPGIGRLEIALAGDHWVIAADPVDPSSLARVIAVPYIHSPSLTLQCSEVQQRVLNHDPGHLGAKHARTSELNSTSRRDRPSDAGGPSSPWAITRRNQAFAIAD